MGGHELHVDYDFCVAAYSSAAISVYSDGDHGDDDDGGGGGAHFIFLFSSSRLYWFFFGFELCTDQVYEESIIIELEVNAVYRRWPVEMCIHRNNTENRKKRPLTRARAINTTNKYN